MFIEILKAIVFGIIEGITEWLPISSTGHMIILGEFFGFKETQGADFYNFFLVIIQLGAILAVIISFFIELWPFGKKKSKKQKKDIWLLWAKILIASIPAGILGVLLDDIMDKYLFNYLVVSITLIVYGLAFLLIEWLLRKKEQRMNRDGQGDTQPLFKVTDVKGITFKYALIIGLAQCLALIPGTSRSGVTICAALLLSIDRTSSARFSFFLSIPAMLGGTLIKGLMYGIKVHKGEAAAITSNQIILIVIGMGVAFVVSLFAIRFFMKLLRSKTFNVFGVYRILLGIALLVIFFTIGNGEIKTLGYIGDFLPSITARF
jgi:undecaprenyl-diphosphatase